MWVRFINADSARVELLEVNGISIGNDYCEEDDGSKTNFYYFNLCATRETKFETYLCCEFKSIKEAEEVLKEIGLTISSGKMFFDLVKYSNGRY